MAYRDRKMSVGAYTHARNRAVVPVESMQALARLEVPDPKSTIRASGDSAFSVGVHANAIERSVMSFDGSEALASYQITYVQVIGIAQSNLSAIKAKAQAPRANFMPFEQTCRVRTKGRFRRARQAF